MTEQQSAAPRKSRRRKKRLESGGHGHAVEQLPWGQPRYVDPPVEPLDAEGVERIHDTSMRILEEIGIEFLHEEARRILEGAGCRVEPESTNVKMDRAFVMEQVAKAPSSFTITPRNPDHRIVVGDGHAAFGQVASPPSVSDLDKGRRTGNRQDFQNLLKLAQSFNCIHFNCGYPVEPVDLHPSIRHLDAVFDLLTLTDKVLHPYPLGKERIEDGMEMARIATGLTWEEFESTPRMFTNINSSSPLKHDWPMLDGAMRLARHRQPVIITPFTLSGAMAPVTLAGAVAQQNAEALCCIALLQVVQPGTPVVYGSFTSNVDMKTGAPAFGTPEYMRATQMSGQMARRYNLPIRVSNANASNTPDAQATWESVYSLQAVSMSHGNMVYHAAGWLEGGLCASFEKFIIDCELLQQFIYYQQPVSVTEDDLAIDAIKQVGPTGHFLGCDHTQERYRNAFYSPFLSDWSNFEQWEKKGSLTATQRANRTWKKILEEYQPPQLDSSIREELEAYVERRKREGGAPTDF